MERFNHYLSIADTMWLNRNTAFALLCCFPFRGNWQTNMRLPQGRCMWQSQHHLAAQPQRQQRKHVAKIKNTATTTTATDDDDGDATTSSDLPDGI